MKTQAYLQKLDGNEKKRCSTIVDQSIGSDIRKTISATRNHFICQRHPDSTVATVFARSTTDVLSVIFKIFKFSYKETKR